MLAHDHALIHFPTGLNHHRAAIFQIPHGVSNRFTNIIGDQHAVTTAGNFALILRITIEQPVHDGGAARIRQQFTEIADEAARRRVEHKTQTIAT